MDEFVLTILDVSGIQDYIFGSNKLRENIGASHLVEQTGGRFLYEALNKAGISHNLVARDYENKNDIEITDRALEDHEQQQEDHEQQQAEVIYRGGGNIVALFLSEPIAKKAVREISQRLLYDAPGLEIVATHYPLKDTPAIGGTDGAYNRLLAKLNCVKQQRSSSVPLLGLSVTLTCRSTGLPAVSFDKEGRAISAEIEAKIKFVKEANQRLRNFLRTIADDYTFSDDFDDFGRSRGENSYVAVVHADGNGMGKRFKQLVDQYPNKDQNRACITALRGFSNAVEATGREALRTTVKRLVETLSVWGLEKHQFIKDLQHKKDEQDGQRKYILPVRPLVFGGDDVTFVSDGRLGLALAAAYLKAFTQESRRVFDTLKRFFEEHNIHLTDSKVLDPVYASTGIAIVKTHYPFRRAYGLSDDLCSNAKSELRKHKREHASALDWHFATTGITASLGEIRSRDYQSKEGGNLSKKGGNLTMRPVTLDKPGIEEEEPWRTWQNFTTLVDTFKNKEPWCDRHNKVVALREALREGSSAVERFRTNYSVALLPELASGSNQIQRTGWSHKRCGYFDAIEALDLYLPLEPLSEEIHT